MKYRTPKRGKTSVDMIPVDGRPVVGEQYHISWASPNVVGVCVEVFDDVCKVQLHTMANIPYKYLTSFNELRHTSSQVDRIKGGKCPYSGSHNGSIRKKIHERFTLKGV